MSQPTPATSSSAPMSTSPSNTATWVQDFAQRLHEHQQVLGHHPLAPLQAAAQACKGPLHQRWVQTQLNDQLGTSPVRRVHYLSMEFLMGRAMGNAMAALGLHGPVSEALAQRGLSLGDVLEREPDAALGNGGLGRLAACFLDSFAELGLPSFGYGLRYQFGMFKQTIGADGQQHEQPDDWMRLGDLWEFPRHELRYTVGFGGQVHHEGGRVRWTPAQQVVATAYDFIVPAHHSQRVSTLRQWHASATTPIDYARFSHGDYAGANAHRVEADTLNWVLYPDDSTEAGRTLRLMQEAFLVSASLQDLIARHLQEGRDLTTLGQDNAIHLNDTHPALAPAELMRLLLDEHGLGWDDAWQITRQAVSYTNHTLMPEALETWPLRMFERLLPRHLEIIYEINARFLAEVAARFPGDNDLARRVSLIDETGERRVRMAALSVVASHRVNGVAQLHSDLMVQTIFADYARIYPERFHNVTNGVTPRRWLQQANPALSALLDQHIGTGWRQDLAQLSTLRPLAQDEQVGQAVSAVKRANKVRLAQWIATHVGVTVNPDSLFDVQVKRIHEYKRQLLNLLGVVARYQAILAAPDAAWVPRTVIIAGKAASAYVRAKQIIRLAHDLARTINNDPRVGDRLKLVFLPNYSVSLAEIIMPAADLSQQISTAGTEASGTGNMKLALNGALTLGTWDGANIEMAQAMGESDMFVFGLRAEAVAAMAASGYRPADHVAQTPALQAVLHAIGAGAFNPEEPGRYGDLVDNLMQEDRYFLMADFSAYVAAQAQVDALYAQPAQWQARVLRNIAGMGGFSSDRTIAEYVERVWSKASLG